MTDLSPAAQAVLTAQARQRCLHEWSTVNDPPCHPSDPGWNGCGTCVDRGGIAAALRALAEQVVPLPRLPYDSCCDVHAAAIRAEILAIAAELEGVTSR